MKRFPTASLFIFALLFLAYFFGLLVDIMEVDAAQYASISRQMLETGDYLQLYNRDMAYLDKPPLLFWLSALSLKIFGLHGWAYKLPSFLCSLLAVYAVFRLSKLFYGERAGAIAALIYVSCMAMFLMNNDVRTDNLLTSFTVFAIWQLAEYLLHHRYQNLFWGFVGIACAMMAKGPMGVMMPALALGTHLLLKRSWSDIFRWQWFLGLVIVALLLTPMCIGLYQQYGTEGLYFFFWKQSFGRLTGENVWKNDTTPFYLVHNFLWAFMPWVFVFILAFWKELKALVQNKFRLDEKGEAITLGGFVLPFIALSLSSYQLPHYVFVVLPMAAVISGKYLDALLTSEGKVIKVIKNVQGFLSLLVFIVAGALLYAFPDYQLVWIIVLLLCLSGALFFFIKGNTFNQLLFPSLIAIAFFALHFNAGFYRQLLQYQGSSQMGQYYKEQGFKAPLYSYHKTGHALDFYADRITHSLSGVEELRQLSGDFYLYTNEEGYAEVQAAGISFQLAKEMDHFKVQFLTLPFLNPQTREEQLSKRYLLYFE